MGRQNADRIIISFLNDRFHDQANSKGVYSTNFSTNKKDGMSKIPQAAFYGYFPSYSQNILHQFTTHGFVIIHVFKWLWI